VKRAHPMPATLGAVKLKRRLFAGTTAAAAAAAAAAAEVADNDEGGDDGTKENASIFLSVFPMFVPSLSWQNDAFLV
jgi:hypothetical protein